MAGLMRFVGSLWVAAEGELMAVGEPEVTLLRAGLWRESTSNRLDPGSNVAIRDGWLDTGCSVTVLVGRGGVTSLISPLLGGVRSAGDTAGLVTTVTEGVTLVVAVATVQVKAVELTGECVTEEWVMAEVDTKARELSVRGESEEVMAGGIELHVNLGVTLVFKSAASDSKQLSVVDGETMVTMLLGMLTGSAANELLTVVVAETVPSVHLATTEPVDSSLGVFVLDEATTLVVATS